MMTDEKTSYQVHLFSNRLMRKYRQLRRWARREHVMCYRLYDRDIPEVPLAVDMYEFLPDSVRTRAEAAQFAYEQAAAVRANDAAAIADAEDRRWLRLFLYERPYQKDAAEESRWLEAMAAAASGVLHISRDHIITKMRKRQKGESQYERQPMVENAAPCNGIGLVQEGGLLFKVNLRDYLDTGLFFDHRPLRALMRASCNEKRVLNLFCYTGSFSVYAADGGARLVDSVDLSNTYLAWAQENMRCNGFASHAPYRFIRNDVSVFLDNRLSLSQQLRRAPDDGRYDIIILDPPTFSNSKSTRSILDINRDWSTLCTKCLRLLANNGTLYFSTNSQKLVFDTRLLPTTVNGNIISIEDITTASLPEDFRSTRSRRCWRLQCTP